MSHQFHPDPKVHEEMSETYENDTVSMAGIQLRSMSRKTRSYILCRCVEPDEQYPLVLESLRSMEIDRVQSPSGELLYPPDLWPFWRREGSIRDGDLVEIFAAGAAILGKKLDCPFVSFACKSHHACVELDILSQLEMIRIALQILPHLSPGGEIVRFVRKRVV